MKPDLFPGTKPPRAKPRKLMHVCDSGLSCCADDDDREVRVQFRCGRCEYLSEWLEMLPSEANRGIPCPMCNAVDNPVMAGLDRTSSGAIGQP